MDRLERELQLALERKRPSPDFAARVGARVAAAEPARVVPIRRAVGREPLQRQTLRQWIAAAAAVVVLAGAGLEYREYRGRVAKERVMLAMRITAAKLNRIQTRVLEIRQ